ncbi:MAG: hypothetical protein LIP02_01725 [Bacteroidales bacterium]|nr:hypothetical protein [Bacteroidales bacterium]
MTKFLKWCLLALTVVTLSATFTACGGDDDDEPGSSSSSSSLAGYWVGKSSNVYIGFYFASDGTGWEFEYCKPYSPYAWTISWKMSGNLLVELI